MPSFEEEFRELEQLQERMRRFLDYLSSARLPQVQFTLTTWTPPVDIYETAEEYVVVVELPGVDPEGLSVSLEDHELRVRGEKTSTHRWPGVRTHRLEIATGPFERSVRLPGPVISEGIRARYNRGVLEVRLPKGQSGPVTRRVEILDDF